MGCCSGKMMVKSPLDMTKPIEFHMATQSAAKLSNISDGLIGSPLNIRVQLKQSKFQDLINPYSLPNTLTPNASPEQLIPAIPKTKNLKEIQEISKCLSKHFLFNSLPSSHIHQVLQEFQFITLGKSTTLFEQGKSGHYFYIINSGKVEVLINNERKKVLNQGETFGDLALLHNSLRTASVRTLADSSFWRLARETFISSVKSISQAKMQENKQFIESIELFQVLTRAQREALLNVLVPQDFEDGQRILNEGDPGNMMFVIKTGAVACFQMNKEIRRLASGEYFGEQALLYNFYRTATAVAVGWTELLSIGRDDLLTAFGAQLQYIIYRNTQKMCIEADRYLKRLSKEQIESVVKIEVVREFKKGDVVVPKGQEKRFGIYSVLNGSLNYKNSVLTLYSVLGSQFVVEDSIQKWDEDWVALEDSHIAFISLDDLQKVLGSPIKCLISNNEILNILKKVQLLRALPSAQLQKLCSSLSIVEYENNQIIFSQGSPGDSFFIVKEGQVEIQKDGISLRTITRHDFFGERSIVQSENRSASAISQGKSACWVLNSKDFKSIINESIMISIKNRIHLQSDDLKLSDLKAVKLLGKGTFGDVFLVYEDHTKFMYALKSVSKEKIRKFDLYDNLILERKIMLQVDHPFIEKMVKSFKDQDRIYFLLEHVQGIDLFDGLRVLNILNNESTKFYSACILMILEHLEEREIIYRDLKPENIMIDSDGYLKLIDFGTAKFMKGRTYTIIGTPHYMAPEVIKGIGYTNSADLWSLGIMIYEFVCGSVPFGSDESDPILIYQKVIEKSLKYPSYIGSQRSKQIIEKLLDPNPSKRGNSQTLKDSSWFLGVDWDSLLFKQVTPPYKPPIINIDEILSTLEPESALQMIQESESKLESFNIKAKPEPLGWDDEF